MSRKGVVINDPSVRTMNDTQWAFEYNAILKREQQYMDIMPGLMKVIRQMIVDILGLDIGKVVKDDFEYVVPLTALTGTPELISAMLDRAKQEAGTQDAVDDDDFDTLSKTLMEQTAPDSDYEDGDILPFAEPIDTESDSYVNAYLHSDEYQAMFAKLVQPRGGVQIMDTDCDD